VLKNGTATLYPLTVKLPGGAGTFLSAIVNEVQPNEYRISSEDILPNGDHGSWFGFNEQYHIYTHNNPPPVSGINHDYNIQRVGYMLEWAIDHLPVDTNSIY